MFRIVVAGTLIGLASPASAVVPGARFEAPTLTALPSAGLSKPLRTAQKLNWNPAAPGPAWDAFVQRRGGRWQSTWDAATGVPSRIWGEGVAAPGSVANAAAAEQFARQFLADHIALLAPGASPSDFVLASNVSDGALRTVAFYQRKSGVRVLGGQVSFRFKADRMFAIGSEALPNVAIAVPRARLAVSRLRDTAAGQLRTRLALPHAPISQPGDEVILPLVADDTVLGYRLVRPVTIDGGFDGRYAAYADVATGPVLAVRQLNVYATGSVLYRTVDRNPAHPRKDVPAPRVDVQVNGAPQTTSTAGMLMWSSETPVDVKTSVIGQLAMVVNKADEQSSANTTLQLTPGAAAVWDASGTVDDDAQVNAYIATNIVKDYVRDHIDAAMPTLDDQIKVNVNINQACNAYFDGTAINFFQASDDCQNTALIQDVVFHEFGHSVHSNEIIPGVGDFDGAMSEGAADFLAASITGDPGMGRGFFYTEAPLRDLDPTDSEWTWPRDIGEIHHTGQIYGGIFWDLRKALIDELGEQAAIPVVNKIYLGTLRRSINIPTSLIEALVEDDDDGNLANGTPHECAIRDAYGRHGLRTASGTVNAPGLLEVNARSVGITIDVSGLSDTCDGDEVTGAKISWKPGYGGIPTAGDQDATRVSPTKFFAQLPLSPQEAVFYKATIDFADGSSLTLADNYADPYYQLYQGETVKLYCTNFDSTDPFSEGWTTGFELSAADVPEPPVFEWGTPPGTGATDPHAAFSGTNILAQALGRNYAPNARVWVNTPTIDVGRYSDVRLQYRRWLASEDSHYDKAMVTANGNQAWLNLSANNGDSSSLHHVDKEWRFHDVPLSSRFSGHQLTVGWEITSDSGLELGGWALDDVCIVANPYAICGDGVKTPTEQCDTGSANADAADVCRTDCSLPKCGDGIVDSSEQCDVGPNGDEVCSNECTMNEPVVGGCGCQSSRPSAAGFGLFAFMGALVLRRRRSPRR
jgi:MYXO-CTERM domain-containing protein